MFKDNIQCFLGIHDDKVLFSINHNREQVSQCKRCGKYEIFNKYLGMRRRTWRKPCDTVEIPDTGIGDLSDGYHTFNELYHHRAVLFSVICNADYKAWKSKLHDDGTMFDGMFIVGIDTPEGQATYHYNVDPYWDIFKVKELANAPKWDGHTPKEAIRRIGLL